MKTIVCLIMLLLLVIRHPFAQENPLPADSLLVDGLYRNFLYYAPKKMDEGAALLFVLHGATIDGDFMRTLTHYEFERLADRERIIVVYPNGYQHFWNGCRHAATYAANTRKLNEAAFFQNMVRFFKVKYQIDTSRVFAVGYSNGGHLCYKLALESPQLFRAFAVFGANLPESGNNDCQASNRPVSMLIVNGSEDPINPFEGGTVAAGDGQPRGRVLSTTETFKYWKQLLPGKCTEKTLRYPDEDGDGCYVLEQRFENKNFEVSLLNIQNGGHTIPHPKVTAWPGFVGKVNRDINGPLLVWDFFERQ